MVTRIRQLRPQRGQLTGSSMRSVGTGTPQLQWMVPIPAARCAEGKRRGCDDMMGGASLEVR